MDGILWLASAGAVIVVDLAPYRRVLRSVAPLQKVLVSSTQFKPSLTHPSLIIGASRCAITLTLIKPAPAQVGV